MGQIVFWILVGAWVALEVSLHVAHNPRVRQSNRIRIEEGILKQAFGEQYRLCRARTRMILPGVW